MYSVNKDVVAMEEVVVIRISDATQRKKQQATLAATNAFVVVISVGYQLISTGEFVV